jgi:hypothetical protein
MDETVLTESRVSESVLITADKDFGELVFRQRQASTGVLPIRLWGLGPEAAMIVFQFLRTSTNSDVSRAQHSEMRRPIPAHALGSIRKLTLPSDSRTNWRRALCKCGLRKLAGAAHHK